MVTPAEAFHEAIRLYRAGDAPAALSLCEKLLPVAPDRAEIWQLSGLAAFAMGNYTGAGHRFARALLLAPGDAAYTVNFANALIKLDRDAEAERALMSLATPRSAEAETTLGLLARRAGRLDDAVAHADAALAVAPGSYEALVNRGRALHELGWFDDAIASYDAAIAVDPAAAPAHGQKALSLLRTGRLAEGWREYEWRGEGGDLQSRARFAEPEWDGAPLAGRTLLVHAEQGFGDSIQFARFLPLVEAAGGSVIFEVQPALTRLFTGFSPSIRVVERGAALPPFDLQIRLMSLPRVLGADLGSLPPPVAFAARASGIILPPDPRPTVALCWAGNPAHENDRNRSVLPAALEPLGRVGGIRFVSVQKLGSDGGPVPAFVEIDLGPRLVDFADLKAVLEQVDLLVSVDTAPAHLMGSLGRPVWLLLPEPPDWRWQPKRDDSPWYPSMRLYRQWGRGEWLEPVEQVAAMLGRIAEKGVPRPASSD